MSAVCHRISKESVPAFAGLLMLILLILSDPAAPVYAQSGDGKFTLNSGAELAGGSVDLDVGYVPTPIEIVNEMFALSSVGPHDFLIDLGSGDGRIVIAAAKRFGTRGLGVDLNAKLVELSRKYAASEGVSDLTEFRVEDIFLTDIRKADVVTLYLLPEVNLKLRPRLLKELKPGTRIVSHDYHMGDWRPDKIVLMEKVKAEGDDAILYYWVVPANVGGRWRWQIELRGERTDFLLELRQNYQDIGGVVRKQQHSWPVFNPELTGDRIRFSLACEVDGRIIRQDYAGHVVAGAVIQGSVRIGGATEKKELPWKARRLDR